MYEYVFFVKKYTLVLEFGRHYEFKEKIGVGEWTILCILQKTVKV